MNCIEKYFFNFSLRSTTLESGALTERKLWGMLGWNGSYRNELDEIGCDNSNLKRRDRTMKQRLTRKPRSEKEIIWGAHGIWVALCLLLAVYYFIICRQAEYTMTVRSWITGATIGLMVIGTIYRLISGLRQANKCHLDKLRQANKCYPESDPD